jgi:predicted transcriptional regulator
MRGLESAEKWLGPKQIALQYNVSYRTALRWIKKLMGDDLRITPLKKGRTKRPYHLRRVPQSLLEQHISNLLNG